MTGIDVDATGACAACSTDWGDIEAEVVVDAGGMFAAEIARLAGVRVPIVPFAHEYARDPAVRSSRGDRHLPTLRDPDLLVYYREEGDGLVMGGYERRSAPWSLRRRHGLRRDPAGLQRAPARGRLGPLRGDRAPTRAERVPAMEDVKVTRLINGPEAFTPDGEFCLGGDRGRAASSSRPGFCAHGLAGAGGIGKVMAEWIVEGEPSLDLWHMDVRRFGAHYRSPSYTLARTRGDLRDLLRHPVPEPRAVRRAGPLRASPAYAWHEGTARPSARSPAGSA